MKYLRVNRNTLISLDRRDVAAWNTIQRTKTTAMLDILCENGIRPEQIRRLLVLGVGNGSEATCLTEQLSEASLVGIDIVDYRFAELKGAFDFVQCDARCMPFEDSTFDLVYSYHTLEHIPRPHEALIEIYRVLRPGGVVYAGVPNKSRLVGYINTADASLMKRIGWNAREWADRLMFRWSNHLGAHAGFTRRELLSMMDCAGVSVSRDVSLHYYRSLYKSRSALVNLLERTGLSRILYPSVYGIGIKNDRDGKPMASVVDTRR